MKNDFTPQDFEKTMQQQWEHNDVFKTPLTPNTPIGATKNKKYILEAFAYPSGVGLHAGHAEGYTGTDIVARFYRMQGFDVLYPVGWDAFGLPAESYAIKNGVHPRENTDKTIKYYQEQVRALGLSNDWNDEIASHNPEYYRWTQWFFAFLYKRGLAYKKEAMVNWDPVDQTVLANEQVLPDGTAERSGAKVEQRLLNQWFFKITDYAERLLQDLDTVDWPESTKQMQRNWIGKSEGAIVHWDIADREYPEFIGEGSDVENANPVRERAAALIRVKETGKYVVRIKANEKDFVFLAGGKIEDNETPYQAAVRETKEEIGIEGLELITKIGVCHDYGPYPHETGVETAHYLEHYYLFEISEQDWINRSKAEVDDETRDDYGEVVCVDEQAIRANKWENFNWVLDNLTTPNQFQISTFTTRIDTIYSGTFLILGPEHYLVETLTTPEQFDEVTEYQEKTKRKTNLERTDLNKDKTGVFTGSYAINPATGDRVQVWISDFVIGTYGTGAVFADAHDERDFELAKKFGIPLKTSLKPKDSVDDTAIRNLEECFSGYGILYNSDQFDGLTSEVAKTKIAEFGESKGWAKTTTNYRLRDWLVSRQRYWGAPIPIVYNKDGKEILVDDSSLPVLLPDDVAFAPTGRSPLYDHDGFHASAEAKYGVGARREVDTMDTFVCSSWYMFRFTDPHNKTVFADKEKLKKWMPIDEYIIGAEHTVLHLLYARFFTKVLFDAGYIDHSEPFVSMRHPGMIQGEDGRKMSKRWGNVINPIEVINEFGADTLRMYEMFMGPFDQSKLWNTSAIKGVRRFLDRVWKMQERVYTQDAAVIASLKNRSIAFGPEIEDKIESELNKLIKKVTEDIPKFAFNTSVAEFMKFVNCVEDTGAITQDQWDRFLLVLAPFAPFITEKLVNKDAEITPKSSIHLRPWPSYDISKITQNGVVIGVQINGKARSEILVTESDIEATVLERIKQDPIVIKWLEDKGIRTFIYVPMKIVNLVIDTH